MAVFGHFSLDSHKLLVIVLLFLRLQGRITQEIGGGCVSPNPPSAQDCQIHVQAAIQEFLEEYGIEPKEEPHPSEEATLESTDDQIKDETEETFSDSVEETEEDTGETNEIEEADEEEDEEEEKEQEQLDKEVEEQEEAEEEEEEEEEEEGDDEEEEETTNDDDDGNEEEAREDETERTEAEEIEEHGHDEDDEQEHHEEEDDDEDDEDENYDDEPEVEEHDHDEKDDREDDALEAEHVPEEETVESTIPMPEEEEQENDEDDEEEVMEEPMEQSEFHDEEQIDEDEEQDVDLQQDETGEQDEEEAENEESEQEDVPEETNDEEIEEETQDEFEEDELGQDKSENEETEQAPSSDSEEHDKSEEYKSTTEELSQPPEGNETSTTKDPFSRLPEEPSEEAYIIGAGMAQELSVQDAQADQSATTEEEEEDDDDDDEHEEEEEGVASKEDEDEEELTTKEEEDEVSKKLKMPLRDREHIDELLGLSEIGTQYDKEDQEYIDKILHELKRIYENAVKPLEMIFKFRDISTRLIGDAEIYAKPMVLFVGPWSSGKTSVINYLLNTERSSAALKTGPEPTDVDFTIIKYGDTPVSMDGLELAADWAFSSVQKFGQGFLQHFKGIQVSHRLLKKLTLVDTPGIMENRKPQDRGYPFNDALQWFIDRADVIYVVLDPSKLEMGSELESLLDQLKGREAQIRFILNKADTIRRSDIMKVVGQLFWNLSPLMGSTEAPVIYAVSLMTKPFHPGSPAKFLLDQEMTFLNDLRETMDRRVENRILYARRHAVRVRNHAKMVDCYLSTYYKHKSIFSNRKKIADQITENPDRYSIYQGLSTLTNVSRYDLPDPDIYREFFNLHPLYDFKPLQSTCSYFRGCPLDKLDIAISYDLPDLLKKFKKHFKPVSNADKEEEKSR